MLATMMFRKKIIPTKKSRIRYLTMAELVIAMGLSAILFSTVMVWMRGQAVMRSQAHSIQSSMQNHMQTEMLLSELFARAASADHSMQIRESTYLTFMSRGLPSAEPSFRGLIKIELLFDPIEKTLKLRQSPKELQSPPSAALSMKEETLLNGVQSLHWQFLDADMEHFLPLQDKQKNKEEVDSLEKQKERLILKEDLWEEKHLPMMVRLEVLTEKGDRDYVFTLDCQPIAVDITTDEDQE